VIGVRLSSPLGLFPCTFANKPPASLPEFYFPCSSCDCCLSVLVVGYLSVCFWPLYARFPLRFQSKLSSISAINRAVPAYIFPFCALCPSQYQYPSYLDPFPPPFVFFYFNRVTLLAFLGFYRANIPFFCWRWCPFDPALWVGHGCPLFLFRFVLLPQRMRPFSLVSPALAPAFYYRYKVIRWVSASFFFFELYRVLFCRLSKFFTSCACVLP